MKLRARRTNTIIAVAGAVALATSACGSSSASGGKLAKLGAGENALSIIAWAGYAENGSTDPKVDWVTPFEKQTGCKVNAKVGNTSDRKSVV